mmetsp:Transcript_14423/g.45321  ORF Transcript_14423/g.45321 Transcript_14423/m.45321 type:complete len:312 (+) Transcript_14423:29-964(+)|eukprot:CAMPEP_0204596464 /NCGR_PEP_ID=MMETSP0661-20131031/53251_1 /ASSEMBLY_ACC=CAM_ASM_000606 /TAXON_ID=109239 /ORGANISM="Alexandrium margalefi, Strain AMGDE01CS-322" /LENGTH=311 /DNA_ID=CAMNT_0051607073 /DNA_START=16 /DNA_END=951 /DNA_ORIENTATION=-
MGSNDGFLSWVHQVLSERETAFVLDVVETLRAEDVMSCLDLENISAEVVAGIPDISAGKRACINRLCVAAKMQNLAAGQTGAPSPMPAAVQSLPFPRDWPSAVLDKVRMALEGYKGFQQLLKVSFGDFAPSPVANLQLERVGDALSIVLAHTQDTVRVIAKVSDLKSDMVPAQLLTQLADAVRTSAEMPAKRMLQELPCVMRALHALVQQAQIKQQQACQIAAVPRMALQQQQALLGRGGDLMQVALAAQLSKHLSSAVANESEVQQKALNKFVERHSLDSLIFQLPSVEEPSSFTGAWIEARRHIGELVK